MSLKHMLNDSDDHDFYRARTVPEDWDQYNGDYRGYASIEDSSQEHGVYSPLDPVNIDHLLSMQIWDYDGNLAPLPLLDNTAVQSCLESDFDGGTPEGTEQCNTTQDDLPTSAEYVCYGTVRIIRHHRIELYL